MIQRAVPAGLLYGVAVYLFMNFVVLPLSAVRRPPFELGIFLLNMVEHMLLVGLPIALAIRKFGGEWNENQSKQRVARSDAPEQVQSVRTVL